VPIARVTALRAPSLTGIRSVPDGGHPLPDVATGGYPRSMATPYEILRDFALGYPEVESSGACTRTAFKVRKKGFVYLGEKTDGATSVLLKLAAHQPEADALAIAEPELCKVGNTGWTTLFFDAASPPDLEMVRRWIDDSYRKSAPKKLVAGL
jgi:hypothetical protein